jgi:hypothetical protein
MASPTQKLFMPPVVFRNKYDGTSEGIQTNNVQWHKIAAELFDESGNGAGQWLGMYDRDYEKDKGELGPNSTSATATSWESPDANFIPQDVIAAARSFEACLRHPDAKAQAFCLGDGESSVTSFLVHASETKTGPVDPQKIVARITAAFGFDPYYANNETNLKKHQFGPIFRFSQTEFEEAADEYAEDGCPPAPDIEVAENILGWDGSEESWEQFAKATQILKDFGETYSMRLGDNDQALGPYIFCSQNEEGAILGAICESQW